MNLSRRVVALEAASEATRPGVNVVALGCPPDGRTRAWLTDGTELEDGSSWREHVGEIGPTVVRGVDIDTVVGRRPGLPLAELGGPAPRAEAGEEGRPT